MWNTKQIAFFLIVLFCTKIVVGNTVVKLPQFQANVTLIHFCQQQKTTDTKTVHFINNQENPVVAFAINCHQVFIRNTDLSPDAFFQTQKNHLFYHLNSSTLINLDEPLPPPQQAFHFA